MKKRIAITIVLLLLFVCPAYAWFGGAWDSLYGQLSQLAGNIVPGTDNTYNLGSSTSEFKDIYSDGVVYLDQRRISGTAGGLNLYVSEAIGTATAASTFDIEVNIPSGARILGSQLRVDTALSSGDGGTTWSAAYIDGTTASIGSGLAFTKNTKNNVMYDANTATDITTAETDITVSINSNNFTAGGVVRAIIYYEDFSTMADN